MDREKRIALVAHDNRKRDLIEWVEWNCALLLKHSLVCTGTTGRLVEDAIKRWATREGHPQKELSEIKRLKSGPLGGDQQLGAMIAEGAVDVIIFFWDPMEPQPHDVDVKALLRIAVVYNIPIACNRATADFVISSALMSQEYTGVAPSFAEHINRPIDVRAG